MKFPSQNEAFHVLTGSTLVPGMCRGTFGMILFGCAGRPKVGRPSELRREFVRKVKTATPRKGGQATVCTSSEDSHAAGERRRRRFVCKVKIATLRESWFVRKVKTATLRESGFVRKVKTATPRQSVTSDGLYVK